MDEKQKKEKTFNLSNLVSHRVYRTKNKLSRGKGWIVHVVDSMLSTVIEGAHKNGQDGKMMPRNVENAIAAMLSTDETSIFGSNNAIEMDTEFASDQLSSKHTMQVSKPIKRQKKDQKK